MITFNKVHFSYPKKEIFKDVNFKIDKGEFVFLIGESGTGKTTLLRMINMELVPRIGEVTVAEFNTNSIKKPEIPLLRRKIGFVFQDFKLLNDRNVFDNVALPLYLSGVKPAYIKKKVFNVLNEVGVFDSYRKMPEELSGGEQQRVSIARAIVNEPLVLIADEPTGNLDPFVSFEIIKLLLSINYKGTAVLVATHNYEIVKKLRSKRLMQIKDKKVFEVVLKD
ncbi:MAG: ATP-binding cassette domain-containing protein [Ignavibacteriae bacterium]|nr:MAG: ATP-binding cassette domain-containing protein [Ignavibacteriota bacterium]